MWKESGNTCMSLVSSMIPEAKAFTITKGLFSGSRVGTDRVASGRHTSTMFSAKMAEAAMSFSGSRVREFSMHPFVVEDDSWSPRRFPASRTRRRRR
ncbi:unnamed protein product [Linum trigynum]|uniref:Uncharacterized protein n=1 Tax=Linum trigynum TaxID=586398 RepID=A0AAV2FYC7_9ROSI